MDISSLCLPLVKITGRRLEDFRIAAGWVMSHDSNLTLVGAPASKDHLQRCHGPPESGD